MIQPSLAKHKTFRKVAVLSAAFSFLWALSASAADCEIKPSKLPEVAARSIVIAFPDGREITVVGHNHGARTSAEAVLHLAERSAQDSSNEEYLDDLGFQLEQQPDAARDSKADLAFLKKYLAQNPEAKFVGIEGSPLTVKNQFSYYERVRAALSKQRGARKLGPRPLDLDVQVFAYGATSYLKMTDPGVFKGRSVLGYESQSKGDAFQAASDNFQIEAEKLQSGGRVSLAGLKALQSWIKSSLYYASSPEGEKLDAQKLATLRKKLSAKDLAASESLIQSRLKVLASMKARDQASIASILEQDGSGVAFVGLAHLKSYGDLLKQACESRISGAPPARPSMKSGSTSSSGR